MLIVICIAYITYITYITYSEEIKRQSLSHKNCSVVQSHPLTVSDMTAVMHMYKAPSPGDWSTGEKK